MYFRPKLQNSGRPPIRRCHRPHRVEEEQGCDTQRQLWIVLSLCCCCVGAVDLPHNCAREAQDTQNPCKRQMETMEFTQLANIKGFASKLLLHPVNFFTPRRSLWIGQRTLWTVADLPTVAHEQRLSARQTPAERLESWMFVVEPFCRIHTETCAGQPWLLLLRSVRFSCG